MDNYELKLESFRGPLDKLLELIEARKLPITSVSLAEVTADFLGYLKTLNNVHPVRDHEGTEYASVSNGVHPRVLADFINIASKLILIKSHTLLPQLQMAPEEKEEMEGLEEKLRVYKELKLAEKNIKTMWAKNVSFGRDFLKGIPAGFYLSQPVTPEILGLMLAKITAELATIIVKNEEGKVVLINFEAKMKELMERVDKTLSSSFNEITRGKKKEEVIVLFLAVLHLLKDSLISITQTGDFADITIDKRLI